MLIILLVPKIIIVLLYKEQVRPFPFTTCHWHIGWFPLEEYIAWCIGWFLWDIIWAKNDTVWLFVDSWSAMVASVSAKGFLGLVWFSLDCFFAIVRSITKGLTPLVASSLLLFNLFVVCSPCVPLQIYK